MKSGLRILGLDDGPFKRDSDTKTVLVGVLMRVNSYVEGISVRNNQEFVHYGVPQ